VQLLVVRKTKAAVQSHFRSFPSSEPFPVGYFSFADENACYMMCIGLRLPRDGKIGVFCQHLNCAKSSYNSFLTDLFRFSSEFSPSCIRFLVKADAKRPGLEWWDKSSRWRCPAGQSDILHLFGVTFYNRRPHFDNFAVSNSSERFPFAFIRLWCGSWQPGWV